MIGALFIAVVAACYPGTVISVYDGDTATVSFRVSHEVPALDLTLEASLTRKIRVNGLRAPELSEPWGKEARAALAEFLGSGSLEVCPVYTNRSGKVVCSFCRLVAELKVDGMSAVDHMVDIGLGERGKKQGWSGRRTVPEDEFD